MSCIPLRSPRATPREVISKILYLRQRYHFGPGRIADSAPLSPHDRRPLLGAPHSDPSRAKPPASQSEASAHWASAGSATRSHSPYTACNWEVKFLERIAGTQKRLYQFTAIDDCTRIRVLKIYDACNQTSAVRFVDEVIRRLPFRVLIIQTDNGAEFQSRFHWHLEAQDIRHVYIRPRTPHLNGKVERSHRVDEQEFYQLLDQATKRQRRYCR